MFAELKSLQSSQGLNYLTLGFTDPLIERDFNVHREQKQNSRNLKMMATLMPTIYMGQSFVSYFCFQDENPLQLYNSINIWVCYIVLWNLLLLCRQRKLTVYVPLISFVVLCIMCVVLTSKRTEAFAFNPAKDCLIYITLNLLVAVHCFSYCELKLTVFSFFPVFVASTIALSLIENQDREDAKA